ncbi:Alginate biosynthesis protein AlgA [Roseovarius litorisediminis]|uniref:mannose-1-phosphate guanylyltransferase n=1 Tax=Roseovarius litorisediminis TaxID=1312363 RepID=A0A1Y5SQN7_9RHOB|nr:mannose-1-phosphate guanylyltransferase/mannose-6-phosphate isomerase [Roseovarius litorisediminis]SLN45968.1 Alginate biosynthesis protein AlgA [Roseovarius litorisediminis]
MHTITPVILCGGSGTRLWPLSRKSYPKQFAHILGDESLLQACAKRLSGGSRGVSFAAPLVLTNSDFRFMVTEQLLECGIDPGAILIEPEARNTGPAILAAALHAAETDPDAILLVAPSDHVIPDHDAFHAAVAAGVKAVEAGRLVTFGISPTYPETGYGYLDLAARPDDTGAAIELNRFVEKPDAATAADMLKAGHYLWNGGIFLFAARDIIAAYKAHSPNMIPAVKDAVSGAQADLGFLRLDSGAWGRAESISIDFAVMEKADNLSVVPFTGHWSDLGSWAAVLRESTQDENGVATSGPTTAIDCSNSLLRSENDGLQLVGVGLENIMVVAMPDAVLVADMNRTQDVGKVVKTLRDKKAAQAESFARDHRPWGYFETLALSDRFQVKRIVVKPGAALSLQSHVHRSEHWIVVSGTAKVTVDETIKLVSENESVYIPLGAVHRMENPGKLPMVLIEVQTGAYLGEDDIVRYEDVYSRGQGAKG